MDVTEAANRDYFNTSSPGLLDHGPGQEQGLIVFLYEFVYAG